MSDSLVQQHYCVQKGDLNGYGIMHGGRLLTLCDNVGFLAAHAHSGMSCLTVGVHQGRFYQPVKQGQELVIKAQVALAGNTCLWVPVRVSKESHTVMEVTMVFVAMNAEGRPQKVPGLKPGSQPEQDLHDLTKRIRKIRRND